MILNFPALFCVSLKASKKVFNFTEIKQQSPLSVISSRQIGGLNAVKYKNKNMNFILIQ